MSQQSSPPPSTETDPESIDARPVEEALHALGAALRSYRLYEGSNPMLDRFVGTARQKLSALWDDLPFLRIRIDEDRIFWGDAVVFPVGDTGSDLPFLFYKDGIRELTILPGFEDEELLSLLGVLSRAPSVRQDEDDLITLLWQEDLAKLRYQVVEAGVEGIEPAPTPSADPKPIDPASVRSAAGDAQPLTTEDFQETLYFLDEAELRKLQDEVRRENDRDIWRDVVNGLLDRLEDGGEERQVRIVTILGELLPSAMATAEFGRASSLLEEVVTLASRPGLLSPPAVRAIRSLFDLLASEQTIVQLAEILEEMPDRLADQAVLRLLSYFPPGAIAAMMRATDRIERPEVRRAFEACVQRLAEGNRDQVVDLLDSDDPAVLTGALRWIGRLEIGSAAGRVGNYLDHADAAVRVAAVEALVSLRAAAAADGIVPLLRDGSREVRISAARALGALGYAAARDALEDTVSSKRLREADRTEKLAFFEAFGRLTGPDGVPVLDRILNGRGWFGRGESAEVRACAVVGLSRIRHPTARDALEAAAGDTDPVVRTAVARALKGDAT